jgi:hypothetical protein
MNEITLNLKSFSDIINNNFLNKEIASPNFRLIFQKYKESLTGCNCSKEVRISVAFKFFKMTLPTINKSEFDNLKKHLNVEKIKFEDQQNQIFLEI